MRDDAGFACPYAEHERLLKMLLTWMLLVWDTSLGHTSILPLASSMSTGPLSRSSWRREMLQLRKIVERSKK